MEKQLEGIRRMNIEIGGLFKFTQEQTNSNNTKTQAEVK